MAKTNAPLLSWSASGQIAQTQVYSEWKGRPYVRRYVIPANPNTPAQASTRRAFQFLSAMWGFMPGSATGAWELYAQNSRFTATNGWIKQNLAAVRGATDLSNMILSTPAGNGLPAATMTPTPGVGQITVTLTAPSLPNGWSIVEAAALAVENVNPSTVDVTSIVAASVNSTPYEIALQGLESGTEYLVGGWFHYTRPDGKPAYGVSTQAIVTAG